MKILFCPIINGLISFVTAQEVVNGPAISITRKYTITVQLLMEQRSLRVYRNKYRPLQLLDVKVLVDVQFLSVIKILSCRATSSISVKYDTKRIGPINKSVTITLNATNEPTKVIRIKGKAEV